MENLEVQTNQPSGEPESSSYSTFWRTLEPKLSNLNVEPSSSSYPTYMENLEA